MWLPKMIPELRDLSYEERGLTYLGTRSLREVQIEVLKISNEYENIDINIHVSLSK